MALTCPASLTDVSLGFTEFLDCSTLSISYDQLGIATLSFTVVSVVEEPTPGNYLNLSFGGISFNNLVTQSLEIRQIPGTLVYEHKYSMNGFGCRA